MKVLTAAAAAVALSVTAGTAMAQCDDGEMVIKFSHVTSASSPKGIAADLLAERVNDQMNGTACMEVYPNSTLYDDDKVLEAMLNGDVQLAAPSLSKFEKYTKKFRIFDLPFMFKNMDAIDAFQASDAGQAMKESMMRRGLLGLQFWHNGLKQFSANKPLIEPSDAAGLKFRVQPSDVLVAEIEALDASPQPMAFSEVYGALQTGVVDGQENTWSNIYTQKFYEVQHDITESNHGLIDYMVVTSAEFWNGLPDETREQVAEALDEALAYGNQIARDKAIEDKRKIAESGRTEIIELSDAERAQWVEAMKPVWQQFEGQIGRERIEAAYSANRP